MSGNQKQWQYLIEFYEDWTKDGYDLVPMLDLVKRLSESRYKDELYPIKSHTVLNISAVEDFYEQTRFPSISINYGRQVFHVSYSKNSNQTHNLEKHKCHGTQIYSLLESLFIRLAEETKTKQ